MRSVAARCLVGVVALAALGDARAARAEDDVRGCIAASSDAQTLRDRGSLVAARAKLLACARDACPDVVRASCAKWLTDVEARTPTVVVRAVDASGADRADAALSIDGRAAKLDGHAVALDPGLHTLVVALDGARSEERLLVVEGERARVVVVRVAAPAPSSAPHDVRTTRETAAPRAPTWTIPTGAWVLGGAGIVAAGAGVAFALVARSDLQMLESTCSPHCADAQTQTGRSHALAADLLLGAGGVAVVGAIVWALAWPSSARSVGVRVDVRQTADGAAALLTTRF